jgi:phosphohistidine phosphatase SixA
LLVVLPADANPADGPPASSAPSTASALLPKVLTYPLIDPSREIKGTALLKALQAGGLVLYMRHTQTGKITVECKDSNLSKPGEEQAREVGARLREFNIPLAQRESSEICRVQDTARLMGVGDFQTNEALNHIPKRVGYDMPAARLRRLAVPPADGTNTLLVGHMHGGENPRDHLILEFGEIIVFRPDGKGASEPVARVRIKDWAEFTGAR